MQRVAAVFSATLAFMSCLGPAVASAPAGGDDTYRNEIERWRQKRVADLKAEDGWLSVTGLYWLRPGETSIGSDPSNDILLPAPAAGLGRQLKLADGKVEFRAAPDVSVTRNGKPFEGGRSPFGRRSSTRYARRRAT